MSGSREASPDWLREFQAPSQALVTLSSGSDSSPEVSPKRSGHTHSEEPQRRHKQEDSILINSGEDSPVVKAKKSKTLKTEDNPVVKAKKPKTLKTEKTNGVKEDASDAQEEGPGEEDIREKPIEPPVSSRLPLVFPDKVHRSKALVECDGDSIDLSGDVGAVGRIVISNCPAGKDELLLDLKGTIYKTTIVPSRTFCIVSVGQAEAKIEAIMNDFIQLEPHSNVFEAETMIEGTLDGFSFDSDEEGDKVPKSSTHQIDQSNENGDQANTKTKGKVEKSSGVVQKKAKTAGKPPKKGGRKPLAVKRTKKSKK